MLFNSTKTSLLGLDIHIFFKSIFREIEDKNINIILCYESKSDKTLVEKKLEFLTSPKNTPINS